MKKNKEFLILGLNPTGPNTSACLFSNKRGLLYFAEEERFTRKKLATDIIPTNSIKFCLKSENINLNDVDLITIGWNHKKYPFFMKKFYKKKMSHPKKDKFSKNVESLNLIEKSAYTLNKKIKIYFKRAGIKGSLPKVLYKNHHESHVASVFYPSQYESALTIILDGSGEEMATSLWTCKKNKLPKLIHSFKLPDSVGYFYGSMTEFLGFSIFTGEGKVMGMSPYGKKNLKIRKKLSQFLKINKDGSYKVDPKFVYFGPRSNSFKHTDYLTKLLNISPRTPESPIKKIYFDIAYETQYLLEKVVKTLVTKYVKITGIRNVCIAGGVANNCKMNGVISSIDEVKNCFALPTSADNGVSFGSAILHCAQKNPKNIKLYNRFNPFLGPSFSNNEIKKVLKDSKVNKFKEYKSFNSLTANVAKQLADGKIVGWFQGKMEVGPRALGNRSILANPSFKNMKKKINSEVKRRESFRPFAPSILENHANKWFNFEDIKNYQDSYKYMLVATTAKSLAKKKIPAVIHVDNSIRPQLVNKKDCPKYYQLISKFHEITSIPVLLNTSLNVRGEPIICKPEEALRCFFSHGLDVLVMGNIVLNKKDF